MLTADAARRIGRAVSAYERGNRDIAPPRIRTADDSDPVRLCKTTAAWNKGTTATLNVWESGTPPSETQSTGETITDVVNKVADVVSGRFVIVAKAANGSWYLVEVCGGDQCDEAMIGGKQVKDIAGYDASKKQALAHEDGCLTWVDIEDCPAE